MNKLSLLVACAAITMVGCGDKDEAVTQETIDQAVQETAVEVEAVVADNESADAVVDMAEDAVSDVAESVMAPATETVAAAAEEPDLEQGKQIYSKNCFACHGSGAAGAPKLGDTDNWVPRIAKGMDTLAQNAIGGFKGSAGYMPPKGGFMALSDADVTAAVAYMVGASK